VAFVLRDLEEMPTEQVAAVLRVSAAAVRQRVHRISDRVRRRLRSRLVGERAVRR
jgi:DNA-directed RNA polymerase specialized sigma24 family protein